MSNDNGIIFKLYVEAVEEQPQMHVDANGTKMWRLHGKLHREDGPAVEWSNGSKAWYMHGERHREDGAAVESLNGYKAWWLHGKRYDDAQSWAEALLQSKNEPSDEQHVAAFLYNLNKKKVNELM